MIIGFMLIEQYRVDRMHSLIGFIEIIRLRVVDEGVTTGVKAFIVLCAVWHYRLWSFQGRDTKLERFLHKNQLQSNEIIEF